MMVLTLFLVVSTGTASAGSSPPLRPEHVAALAERLTEREPFLGSYTARQERQTLFKYFRRAEYANLKGNPLLGYWNDGSFQWAGDEVAWDGIQSLGRCRHVISARAWTAAFRYIAQKRSLKVDRAAKIRLEGACLMAVAEPEPGSPVPGVLLEMRVRSPSGTLTYRLSLGKATIEDAIGASLDLVVQHAYSLKP